MEPETPRLLEWSREELVGLIQYIALCNTNENNSWPTHKQEQFWKSCAAYVSQHSGQSARSGEDILWNESCYRQFSDFIFDINGPSDKI